MSKHYITTLIFCIFCNFSTAQIYTAEIQVDSSYQENTTISGTLNAGTLKGSLGANYLTGTINASRIRDIRIWDTRDDNFPPTQYNKEIEFEFKRLSSIDAPGSGTYGGLQTIMPWGDNTGGYGYQIFYGEDGIVLRRGYPSNSSWESWKWLHKPASFQIWQSEVQSRKPHRFEQHGYIGAPSESGRYGNIKVYGSTFNNWNGINFSNTEHDLLIGNGQVGFHHQGLGWTFSVVNNNSKSYVYGKSDVDDIYKYFFDFHDGWLRLNQYYDGSSYHDGGFNSGVYTPGNLRTDGRFYIGSQQFLEENTSQANYGALYVKGENGGYSGFAFQGGGILMSRTSDGLMGLYKNGEGWIMYGSAAGAARLFYDATEKIRTRSDGAEVFGKMYADSFHAGGQTWPDFVFDPNYDLMPLLEIEKYVKKNRHLPDIPSEKEVTENGVDLVKMNALLLQKVEELTLHIIEINKEMQRLKNHIDL